MKEVFTKTKKDLRLAMAESVVTAGMLSMAIMTPFFYSIGLSNQQVSLSQSIFTIIVLLLDCPMGWIADRVSRKWLNVIGDIGAAVSLLLYSRVDSFAGVVAAECLLAIFNSMSAGVDISLIRHFANKLDSTDRLFKSKMVRLSILQNVATMILTLLGGPIGAIDFRLAIALSAVTYFAGGVIGAFIKDDSEKLAPVHKNPLKDLGRVIVESSKNPKLRLRIVVQAIGREITHPMIWFATPIMMAAGIPIGYVAIGWALDGGAAVLGAWLAKKFVPKWADWQKLAMPIILATISLGAIAVRIAPVTIVFYLLLGVTKGWTSATLKPMVQSHAKPSEQTSVSSLASTVGRIIYAVAGIVVGTAADIDLRLAAVANIIIFLPIGCILVLKLKEER